MKTEKSKETNAKRFIKAYNEIDQSLRMQYDLRRGQTFSEVIRRSSSLNSIVRKFEELLIDYGRLRNAIIHNSNEDYVIAEPHIEVVEKLENIVQLICTPPLAINSVCRKVLLSVQSDVKIDKVIGLIASSGYSNLPVYKDHELIGIANGQRIADDLGSKINAGYDINKYITETNIEDAILKGVEDKYFTIASADLTIEQTLNLFYQNRKLLVIIITKNGLFNEIALGIITVGDIIDLNSVLENYS